MAIEMNFGWLNDYTGSKFAPITLANLVLMDTSNGSTETLFSYITSENKSLKDKNKQQDENILINKGRLDRLLNNNLPEGTKPMAVRMAGKLVEGIGDDGALMNSSYAIGINRGSLILPVYFSQGVPEPCSPSQKTSKQISYKIYRDNKIENDFYDYLGGKAKSSSHELNVDIQGYACYAEEAEKAIVANSAKVSEYAGQAIKLTTNIGLNEKDGDVIGTIRTTDPQGKTALTLKVLEWKEANGIYSTSESNNENLTIGFGNEFMGGNTLDEDIVFIPSIKIDKKGRVVAAAAKQYKMMSKLELNNMPSGSQKVYLMGVNDKYADKKSVIYYHTKGSKTSNSIYIDVSGTEPVLMGAAWNDYAEYRKQKENIEPGYCVKSNDDGKVEKTTERLSICDGIVSDTFGFSIGKHADYETPLAVSGRVLAYCEGDAHDYHAGDVVCASENGKVCVMTREEIKEYPDRIVGTVSEIPDYDMWNNNKVNGRIWIKVK